MPLLVKEKDIWRNPNVTSLLAATLDNAAPKPSKEENDHIKC